MPGQYYTITINNYNNSGTGHVNVTLTGPNNWSETYGNNT